MFNKHLLVIWLSEGQQEAAGGVASLVGETNREPFRALWGPGCWGGSFKGTGSVSDQGQKGRHCAARGFQGERVSEGGAGGARCSQECRGGELGALGGPPYMHVVAGEMLSAFGAAVLRVSWTRGSGESADPWSHPSREFASVGPGNLHFGFVLVFSAPRKF